MSAAWVFEVDPNELDLTEAFADGEAVIEFDVTPDVADALGPGQVAHLWVQDRDRGVVPAGIYASGSVVSPVVWTGEGESRHPTVVVGFDTLEQPVDGLSLLSRDEFVGSPLHRGGPEDNPVRLDPRQAAAVQANPLDRGPLATVFSTLEPADGTDDGIVLPALEVRLPADTLLVIRSEVGDEWTVVRGDADFDEVEELPDRHATFMDAVEYVAAVAEQASADLPVVDIERGVEAVAIFDATGGVYVVVKTAPGGYTFFWVEDDGSVEAVAEYASLKEAILLPVLDQELFGGPSG